MSLNSSGPANTSVAEMRERRRQKILQNAEERISKILTAHGERRQAPTLDGVTHGADNGGETAPPVELTSNGGWTPVTDDGDGQFRPSNFHWFFDHHRLSAAASFGVLLRLLVHFDMVRSVALTFLPAFIACQFFSHFRRFSNDVTFNAHNSLMTHFLLVYGVNERIVRLGVLIFDVFWQFVTDFCSTTFAFLATHCLIIVLKLFWEQRGGGAVPKVAVAAVGLLPSGFGGVEEAKRARLFVDRRRAPPASPWRASWSCLKSSAAARDGRTWRWWQLWAPRAASEPMEGELEAPRAASEPMEGELELFEEQRGGAGWTDVAVVAIVGTAAAAAVWLWGWRPGGGAQPIVQENPADWPEQIAPMEDGPVVHHPHDNFS
ncbi:hypothetical protein niasHT_019891 [Heterodera trifolii]|uniref:Uncharacterized protein n=1 Tax=Heterodera trifolii TaxID=157864 RepID=A0ABD2KZ91_9BILA